MLEAFEDRTVPTVGSVSVAVISDAVEGGADGLLRFTRTGDVSGTLAVNYAITGTAKPETDHSLSTSGTVTFAPNENTADVTVNATSDSAFEPSETLLATVTSGIGSTSVASMSLFDSQVGAVEV